MMMAAPAAAQELVDAGWGVVAQAIDGDTVVPEQGLEVPWWGARHQISPGPSGV